VNDRRSQVARLAPLLPALAYAWRGRSGEIPPALREAGRHGERHIGALISLAIAGPATVSELAARLEISTAHASLVVGELARAELVERTHDERDRRRIIVSLSDRARPAIDEMRARNAAPLLSFLGELEPAQADRFIDQLARLVAHMRGEQPEARGRASAPAARGA
jgi:DNA-binding MarR family transcriptional regulator